MHGTGILTVCHFDTIIESFRSPFTVNGNGENVIKYHVILSTGNVHGEFLTFPKFRTSFYRSKSPLSFFTCKRIPFNVF